MRTPGSSATRSISACPGLNSLGHGVLAAIDSRTNKIVWKKEFRPGRPSGAMTTAGGLMFQSAPDGNFQAYDAKTGDLLWQFQIGAAGGPPLSYEIDGEQYVAAMAARGRVGVQAGWHAAAGGGARRVRRRSCSPARSPTRRRLRRRPSSATPASPASTT